MIPALPQRSSFFALFGFKPLMQPMTLGQALAAHTEPRADDPRPHAWGCVNFGFGFNTRVPLPVFGLLAETQTRPGEALYVEM